MPKQSAGLLLYRIRENRLEVLLVHPGGPFWASKDDGVWSIPKGEFGDDEDPLAAAQRELKEETGVSVTGPFLPLGNVRLAGGKLIHAFAAPADFDPAKLVSKTFKLEWPPRSGRTTEFPEIDRAAWFQPDAARIKLHPVQTELVSRLSLALEKKPKK